MAVGLDVKSEIGKLEIKVLVTLLATSLWREFLLHPDLAIREDVEENLCDGDPCSGHHIGQNGDASSDDPANDLTLEGVPYTS